MQNCLHNGVTPLISLLLITTKEEKKRQVFTVINYTHASPESYRGDRCLHSAEVL